MPMIKENVSEIPEARSARTSRVTLGRKGNLRDGKPSQSSVIVETLKSMSKGECVTLLPETGHLNEFQRWRMLWHNAARRAGMKVVSRMVTTEAGDRAVRIWRVYD